MPAFTTTYINDWLYRAGVPTDKLTKEINELEIKDKDFPNMNEIEWKKIFSFVPEHIESISFEVPINELQFKRILPSLPDHVKSVRVNMFGYRDDPNNLLRMAERLTSLKFTRTMHFFWDNGKEDVGVLHARSTGFAHSELSLSRFITEADLKNLILLYAFVLTVKDVVKQNSNPLYPPVLAILEFLYGKDDVDQAKTVFLRVADRLSVDSFFKPVPSRISVEPSTVQYKDESKTSSGIPSLCSE